jgi:flagellar motor switch protein FliG
MAATSENVSTGAADAAKLTRQQKLAILLIMLGTDSAAQILKELDDQEVETICAEMAKFTMVSQELQSEILKDFTEVALHASTAMLGGAGFAQAALEKGLGLFKATNIISRVSPNRTPVAAMREIAELEPRQIYNLIKEEQSQMIALVVSYLPSEKASPLMTMLRPDAREQVVERLATLAPTPVEVVERVVEILKQKLGAKHTRALHQTGGVKAAASLLNAVDKNLSKSVLLSLEERNPELGQAIRQKMFTFEDLAALEPMVLQRVLREVDTRELATSLKTASEHLKTVLLGCISKRAAETVVEEMSFTGPLKLRDIEASQFRIIEVLRRLEAEGEVDLGGSTETREHATVG